MSSAFDYYKAVSQTKQQMITDSTSEAGYVPFIVNRTLSYFPDTLFHANEMNRLHTADNKLQFDYYLEALRPRKRFTRWAKKESNEDIEAVSIFYKYSERKAREAVALLSNTQLREIKNRLQKGGSS